MTDSAYLSEGDPDWGWEFVCEDFVFARIAEEQARTGGLPAAALGSLQRIAAWHSTYVDQDGKSWARCFTCEASHGFPCTTMRAMAAMWSGHEDFRAGWADTGGFLADVIEVGGFRRAYLAAREATTPPPAPKAK